MKFIRMLTALIATTTLCGVASAQSLDGSVAKMATRIGAAAKLSAKPQSAINGKLAPVTAADPLLPMTVAKMAATLPPGEARKFYSLTTRVDYNGDGIEDVAYMAENSTQIAVVVQLGGNKGKVNAYQANGQWGGGAEIVPAGKRRILVNFPESSVVVLSAESGKPAAYFYGE